MRSLIVILASDGPSDLGALIEAFMSYLGADELVRLKRIQEKTQRDKKFAFPVEGDYHLDVNNYELCSANIQAHIRRFVYIDIGRRLKKGGKDLAQFGINEFVVNDLEVDMSFGASDIIDEEEQTKQMLELQKRVQQTKTSLNDEQRYICTEALKNVKKHIQEKTNKTNPTSKAMFVNAKGGAGKTYTLNFLADFLRLNGLLPLCSSSTGISAIEYQDGRTVHYWFDINVPKDGESLQSNMVQDGEKSDTIKLASLIVIDEAIFLNKEILELVNTTVSTIVGHKKVLFGGIPTIFAGDFRQCLPIVKGFENRPSEQFKSSLAASFMYKEFKLFYLNHSQRAKGDPQFSQYLDKIPIHDFTPEIPSKEYLNTKTSYKKIYVKPDEIRELDISIDHHAKDKYEKRKKAIETIYQGISKLEEVHPHREIYVMNELTNEFNEYNHADGYRCPTCEQTNVQKTSTVPILLPRFLMINFVRK